MSVFDLQGRKPLVTGGARGLGAGMAQALARAGAAVADVCEAHGCAWSIYRCIGDRYFDGLLDERIIAATNQDGSGNMAEIQRLLQAEPEVAEKLDKLHTAGHTILSITASSEVRGFEIISYSEE